MSKLIVRGGVYWADLRSYGQGKKSLHVKEGRENEPLANWLFYEIEQLAVQGRTIDSAVVRALTAQKKGLAATATTSVVAPPLSTSSIVAAPVPTNRETITLHDAFRLTAQTRDRWSSARVFDAIEKRYNAVAAHFGPARMMHTITALEMDAFKTAQKKAGIAGGTYNNRQSLIKILFDEVLKQYILTRNPKFNVGRPELMERRGDAKRERQCYINLTLEQAVIKHFADHHLQTMRDMADLITVLVYTGLRVGEALGLEQDDINFKTRRIFVQRSGRDSESTKTASGVRSIYMFPRVFEVMDRRVREEGREHPFEMVNHPQQLWARMREELHKENLRDFVIHALRHTCATRLAALGLSELQLVAWMGWSNISMARTYVKLRGVALGDTTEMRESMRCAKLENPEFAMV